MSWTWQMLADDGALWQGDDVTRQAFPSQSDAETWLGESWRELRNHGVAAVSLFEEARLVYGPMSLNS